MWGWSKAVSQLQRCSALTLHLLRVSSSSSVKVEPNEFLTGQPREFHGCIRQIRSGPMKLNLVAKLIRGLPIADALAQIQFCEKAAAKYVEMVLLDTQRKAVQKYDADPLNLWVAESYVGKGQYRRKIRYHGKGMSGLMHDHHAHYFLILKEGKPPKKRTRIEDTWRYRTRKFIEAGPRSIPNSL